MTELEIFLIILTQIVIKEIADGLSCTIEIIISYIIGVYLCSVLVSVYRLHVNL